MIPTRTMAFKIFIIAAAVVLVLSTEIPDSSAGPGRTRAGWWRTGWRGLPGRCTWTARRGEPVAWQAALAGTGRDVPPLLMCAPGRTWRPSWRLAAAGGGPRPSPPPVGRGVQVGASAATPTKRRTPPRPDRRRQPHPANTRDSYFSGACPEDPPRVEDRRSRPNASGPDTSSVESLIVRAPDQ
ncbi:Protein of unknown function [Gryllus bimaculatus]|nr:Protein of unknown function [Gryllus bimaculatus]